MNKNMFIQAFNRVEEQAAANIHAEQGDYILDGLLYCGKCNTQKQVRVELFGTIRTPYCLCKCKAEEKEKEETEHKRQQFLLKIERMRRTGFQDRDMQDFTFSNDDRANEKITAIAKNYVDNFETMRKKGKGLMFYGGVGTGKTFLAACIANALIDKGYPCMVTNFARLVNTIQGMYAGKQEYIDSLNNFQLLVIDDLAAERDTEYMNEIVQNIIDSRYRAGLPTIITTNLSADEIKNPVDVKKQRTYSRLLEMTIPVEVAGKDRRKTKLKNDYNELNELLGL